MRPRSLPSRVEEVDVGSTDDDEERAPPHGCVKVREYRVRRMRVFQEAAGKNQNAVDEQLDADEKPDGNDVVFPAPWACAATLRPPPPLRSPFGCDSMRPLTFPCAPPLDAARGLGPATRLPENPLQDQKDREAQTRPEDGPLYDWKFAFARQIRRAVNQPRQLRVRPRLRQRGDDHGDGDADDPRP